MLNSIDDCKYIFDACSFMELEPDHPLAIEVLPSLWNSIAERIDAGEIVTISEVVAELDADKASDDKVASASRWIRTNNCSVVPLTKEIQEKAKEVLCKEPKILDFKKNKSSADVFLIATAWVYGKTIVTQENKQSEFKIPRVCERLGVKVCTIQEMLKAENIAI